ncbi:aminotransferase class V-fold PLP-dependent enzyme [Streptacidiphilus fuscans]|uniref:Aminotransferase class V-fold PLP-dependent enzyme n=1 Tax=Streptacidiphilus fuscans TaxID=2789292 RepID=A0A931FFU9_9ACTN|nr:aminotransferase class V-fold PLP-dependent enzyme [Streptacidiphilus fuscans]MBF9070655.1 aminotransferase class V-fold PLP-dependent enzyme [Streptacidiphilus fuscans]
MTIDVARVRADTPACAQLAHLNNASAALAPRPVTDSMVEHLRLEERIGAYEAAAQRADRLDRCYAALARLIGAEPHEIALAESATRAWNMACYALPWTPGDRILTSRAEFASVSIAMLDIARKHGVRIDVVPDDATGVVSVDALRDMVDDRVRLIAVTHVPSHNGLVIPAAEIGRIARDAGVVYALDASQSVGQLPLDVQEIGCDLLVAPGRKFLRGPRGTAFLYCSSRLLDRLEPSQLCLHSARRTETGDLAVREDARRFETWERCLAAQIGLGVAAEYALELGLEAIRQRVGELAGGLRQRLREMPGTTVHDRGEHPCGIVSFTVAGHDSAELAGALRNVGINVSATHAGTAPWDHPVAAVRASAHYYNTEDELDRLCSAIPVRIGR